MGTFLNTFKYGRDHVTGPTPRGSDDAPKHSGAAPDRRTGVPRTAPHRGPRPVQTAGVAAQLARSCRRSAVCEPGSAV